MEKPSLCCSTSSTFKHRLTPKRLQFIVLLQVATLCEKYLCIELAQTLARDLDALVGTPKQLSNGRTKRQGDGLGCRTNVDSQLLNKYNWFWREPYPSGIAENIIRILEESVKTLLDIPYALVSKFEKANNNLCQSGEVNEEDNACDGASWGILNRGMQFEGLWPIKPADEVYLSIEVYLSSEQVASAVDTALRRPPQLRPIHLHRRSYCISGEGRETGFLCSTRDTWQCSGI
ncbi:hypothetical protein WAI453_010979 [Rhynchosporium graminicola]